MEKMKDKMIDEDVCMGQWFAAGWEDGRIDEDLMSGWLVGWWIDRKNA